MANATPNKWLHDITGTSGNAGTSFGAPKQYISEFTGGAADDHYGMEANATFTAVGGTGNATFTNKSATVNLPSGHGLSTNDLIKITGSNGIISDAIYQLSISGDTGTIQGTAFEGTTGSYACTKFTPIDPGHTTANGTFGAVGGTDPSSNVVQITGGWTDATTQNGYTVLYISASTTNQHLTISGKNFIKIDRIIFVFGLTNIVAGSLTGLEISNCKFIRAGVGTSNRGIITLNGTVDTVSIHDNYFQIIANCISLQLSAQQPIFNADIYNNIFLVAANSVPYFFGGYSSNITVRDNTHVRVGTSALPGIYSTTSVTAGGNIVFEQQANTWDHNAATVGLVSIGDVLLRNFNHTANRLYQTTLTTRGRIRQQNVNSSGTHEKFVFGIGIYKQNLGDATFGLPSGYTSIDELFFNVSSTVRGYRAGSGVCSCAYCEPICQPIKLQNFPVNSVGVKFRLYYNAPSNALTGNMLWLEVRKMSDSTFYKSGTGALTQRVDLNDWTNYIETDTLTTTVVDELRITPFAAFYDASNKLAIAKMQISPDNGATWINMTQSWVDGEITWQLAPGNPVVGNVTLGVVFGQLNELTGTQAAITASTVTAVTVDPTTGAIDIVGYNFPTSSNTLTYGGVTYNITLNTSTHIQGTPA